MPGPGTPELSRGHAKGLCPKTTPNLEALGRTTINPNLLQETGDEDEDWKDENYGDAEWPSENCRDNLELVDEADDSLDNLPMSSFIFGCTMVPNIE